MLLKRGLRNICWFAIGSVSFQEACLQIRWMVANSILYHPRSHAFVGSYLQEHRIIPLGFLGAEFRPSL